MIKDAELGDTDVVVCEYKINNNWKFLTEEEHMQIILSKCGNCGTKKDNLPFCECKTVRNISVSGLLICQFRSSIVMRLARKAIGQSTRKNVSRLKVV